MKKQQLVGYTPVLMQTIYKYKLILRFSLMNVKYLLRKIKNTTQCQ